MPLTKAFVSYDYDHDRGLKDLLVGQSKNPDSPFAIADHSIKVASPAWKSAARARIRKCDVVIVICGHNTHSAAGVAAEVEIAQEERVPYFLLAGYPKGTITKPTTARASDKLYEWTWENLKALVGGSR